MKTILEKVYGLNRDQSGGHERPHKPALLLAVLDQLETGVIGENEIKLTDGLVDRFKQIFAIVRQGNDQPTIQNPFYYLSGDGFWNLIAPPGHAPLYVPGNVSAPKSQKQLRENLSHVELSPEFWTAFSSSEHRQELIGAIIARFFPGHRQPLSELLHQPADPESEFLLNEESEPERDAAFRTTIRQVYDYRCAACGVRIKLGESNVLIEAAHLIPWAESHNDHPSNGIALCRNHHWAMDRHLIAPCPSDEHAAGIWRVSPTLDTRISDLRELVGFNGEKVIPPEKEAQCYYPSTAALQWRADHLLQAG